MNIAAHFNPFIGSMQVYVFGLQVYTNYSLGDYSGSEVALHYTGVTIDVCLNGVVMYSHPVAAGIGYYPIWHAYTAATTYTGLRQGSVRSAARIGNNLYDNSGVLKAQSEIVTLEGTALQIVGQAPAATDSNIEAAADVTKSASGPAEVVLDYASDGSLTTSLPATTLYKLTVAGGSAYTSGVTWSVSVLSGTFAGTAPSISGSGTGQLAINSGLSGPEAMLSVTASYGGKSYPPVAVKVKKVVAPPPTGGSGGSSSASGTVGSFSTTSFAAVTSSLTVTLPAGVTTATLTASSIGLYLAAAAPGGNTQVEMKWQRETSPGVWADVGATATSNPHPIVSTGEGLYDPLPGSITCNRSATGLSAGSVQTFRLVARCSAGNTRTVTSGSSIGVSS